MRPSRLRRSVDKDRAELRISQRSSSTKMLTDKRVSGLIFVLLTSERMISADAWERYFGAFGGVSLSAVPECSANVQRSGMVTVGSWGESERERECERDEPDKRQSKPKPERRKT